MIPSSPTAATSEQTDPKPLVSVCGEVIRPDGGELRSSTTERREMATAETRHRVRHATLKAEVEMLSKERSSLLAENAALKAENAALCEALEQADEDETNDSTS